MTSPATTTLIILRHGETVWNAEGRLMNQLDAPLSTLGCEQANKLASRMAGLRFDALYSSDLGRAIATAQAISERCGIPATPLPGLREISVGFFAGKTWAEIEKDHPDEVARYREGGDYAVPGGESRRDFQERTVRCLTGLVETHMGETVVAVAHGGTLNAVLRSVMAIPLTAPFPARLPNASFNVFDISDGIWRMRTWGDTSHL